MRFSISISINRQELTTQKLVGELDRTENSKMSQCKVWLDNYNGQYYPGAQIQGKVILNFNDETKLRKLVVRIVCHEHTEWLGSESYYDSEENQQKSRDTLFKGDNDAFSTELILYGGLSGTTSLSTGQHIYPFTLNLPNNLPGTYHCEYGSISYKLVAVVDRPMALDYEDQVIFVVVAPVDLNLLRRPELLAPSSYSDDKTLCCWCCAQGPISLDVDLPKRTLVPGETINVTARLTNMSNTNVEGVGFEMKQRIICLVNEPNKEEKEIDNILVDVNEVGLGAHGEHTYTFNVMLPMNVPIPNFSQCRLFKAEYVYKVVAKLPSVHKNLEVFMYPEIGNIQIYQEGYPGGFNQGGFVPGGPQPGYPENPGPRYPPPVGGVPVYPPLAPTAPPSDYSKSQDASMPSGNLPSEQPPPTYDSLNMK
ncbi:arrestin domain-containing protein 3-like [Anoplophora glabripennis]|uniref:arrestin domain-containing protein 3-like n=1 Tax=Anoplophora glabripennis TaxID=217634 RepID=UPI00087383D2|nr:arrestin domain-containing protein 3-like [Anoplophora glabripennis]